MIIRARTLSRKEKTDCNLLIMRLIFYFLSIRGEQDLNKKYGYLSKFGRLLSFLKLLLYGKIHPILINLLLLIFVINKLFKKDFCVYSSSMSPLSFSGEVFSNYQTLTMESAIDFALKSKEAHSPLLDECLEFLATKGIQLSSEQEIFFTVPENIAEVDENAFYQQFSAFAKHVAPTRIITKSMESLRWLKRAGGIPENIFYRMQEEERLKLQERIRKIEQMRQECRNLRLEAEKELCKHIWQLPPSAFEALLEIPEAPLNSSVQNNSLNCGECVIL